jgi:ubiquinone/menaquinone biosynthesis C-methylase UbiE
MIRREKRCVPATLLLLAGGLLVAATSAATAQDDRDDVERLEKALAIGPGATVAEIGAGSGSLTVLVAGLVGDAGHVYSNEIDVARRSAIAASVAAASLRNVTIVESGARDANLPPGCCDAIFMRNVYHHFPEPGPMAASLFRALKPGGRVAVIDFAPGSGREAARAADRDVDGTHGVRADTVARELRQAGFEVLQTDPLKRERWYIVVAMRPPLLPPAML